MKLFFKKITRVGHQVREELAFKTFKNRDAAILFAAKLQSPSHIVHFSITTEEVQEDFCDEVLLKQQTLELAAAQKVVDKYKNGFWTKEGLAKLADTSNEDY